MNRRTKFMLAGSIVAAVAVAGGTGIAVAAGGDDGETRITGPALERASAAALQHTGGGRVTDTEVGDEESYYEVEVTRADGSQVDVHLDKGFNVLSSVGDNDGSGEKDGPNDD